MKVLAHLDPVVLEHTLLDELAAAQPGGEPQPALILVPTRRLAAHVEQRLLERRPAWLDLEILHFRAVARRILAEAGRPAPRILSQRLIEALVRRVLRRHPDNCWSVFVSERPGALGPVAASLNDLREAGLSLEDVVRGVGEDPGGKALAGLYGALHEEFERVREAGWNDDAGLMATALPHARSFAARRTGIWLHGAYELIGVHSRLVDALDRGREVRVLLPYREGAPVGRFAGRFLTDRALDVEPIDGIDDRPPLEALYDEEARPTPVRSVRFSYRSTQGAAAEIKGAVRSALAAVRNGCPPGEIVIAARSLTPYEAALDEVLEQEGLPWTGSLTQPLRNHPAIHDLALLLAILDEDFPRRGTAELLRSPRVRWERIAEPGDPPRGAMADGWSRAAGVVGGLAEWREVLVEWAGRTHRRDAQSEEDRERLARRAAARVAEAERIGAALERLRSRADTGKRRSWAAHADTLYGLIELAFDTDDPVWDEVLVLLREMRALETIVGETGAVGFADMRRWLEAAIDRTERMPHGKDNGGIRVLDMMQLRGLTCRRLFLVGMNSGVLPRPPRPDPVLSDELRESLRGPAAPLGVKMHEVDEERLLLAMTLGSATETVELAWQRADEAGRGRTPSLALREASRLSHGVPDLTARTKGAEWHPSHPTLALRWLQRTSGMLSSREERLLTALGSVGQPTELDAWYPDLAPGLALLRATEAFEFGDRRFDGRIGNTRFTEHALSVSALERLASCPLQFFFQRLLRVHEFDEEAEPFELTPREIGQYTHDLLERVYRTLRDEGWFGRPLPERVQRATELVEEVWGDAWQPLEQRLSRRAPALWRSEETRWRGAITRFVIDDLGRIEGHGWGAPDAERVVEQEVAFGEDHSLHLSGRLDRSFDGGARRVIGDYKTGRLEKLTDITKMLRGERLQIPLYWMLADGKADVEVLGVGANHDPDRVDTTDRILSFKGMKAVEFDGFLETMRVLTDLISGGVFPLKHDNARCDYCPYELACRHRHPPTLERQEHAGDGRDFSDLGAKTKTKKRTLADVRGEA